MSTTYRHSSSRLAVDQLLVELVFRREYLSTAICGSTPRVP
jgi:hypothetical protein